MFKKEVTFRFSINSTSADFGNVWPGREVTMTPAQAASLTKANAGAIVTGESVSAEQDAADKQKRDAGDPTINNVLHGGAKPVSKMNRTELLAEAKRLKIKPDDDATNAILKDLINAKNQELAEAAEKGK